MIKPSNTLLPKTSIVVRDKFPKLPKDQNVNRFNCSAVLKYVNTPIMALAKLPNINPTINKVVVCCTLLANTKTSDNKTKLPEIDAKAIPYGDCIKSAKKTGKWLILVGHEMDRRGEQTSLLSTLEAICKYAMDPSNEIWIDNVHSIASYILEKRNEMSFQDTQTNYSFLD